jgi:hypothetical protein
MKKIIYILSLIFLFMGCSKNDDSPSNGDEQQTSTGGEEEDRILLLADSGWDIYKAGNYRYGPSVIINDDGSIDAWFAAIGGQFGENVSLTTGEGDQKFVGINNNITAGQKFTTGVPFWGVSICCTNCGGNHCGLTLCLYQWDTDYLTTITSAPVASKVFVDYEDNSYPEVSGNDKFSAGTYLWIINDGLNEYSGLWACTGNAAGVTNYYNGTETSKSYEARYTLEETNRGTYWDQISYQHSTNGGKQWSEEEMVLQPTEYSRNAISCCDPGVAKWGEYYYIGYSSCDDESGTECDVYVCRSKNCDGPWEKWNGEGWGGNPQPVIEYSPGVVSSSSCFGAGEPCFVVLDDIVYLYYSWNEGTGTKTTTTCVSTADAGDLNWPENLVYRGVAVNKSDIPAADHCDIKYDENSKKFLAIHTASRMTENGYIVLWESDDGITFKKVEELHDNLMPYLHNCGWSGDEKGHIREGVQQYLSYAYGETWGQWNTRWVPIEING